VGASAGKQVRTREEEKDLWLRVSGEHEGEQEDRRAEDSGKYIHSGNVEIAPVGPRDVLLISQQRKEQERSRTVDFIEDEEAAYEWNLWPRPQIRYRLGQVR